MNILDILENKKSDIVSTGHAILSADELNIMCDPMQIRTLKVYSPIPDEFEKSADITTCIQRIKDGDCIYRVLEYCILTNRALSIITNYVKRLS